MKTIWTILHLDTPTTDIDVIKNAYSNLVKSCNPEENPEEFQELHNAYKEAIKYAKSKNKTSNNINFGVIDLKTINSDENSQNAIFNENFKNVNSDDNLQNTIFDENLKNVNNNENSQNKTFNENFKNVNSDENSQNTISNENLKNVIFDENLENNQKEDNPEIIEESNDFEDFKNIISEESNDLKITNMMLKIDYGFRKDKKTLKKAVSSEEFQELLDLQVFQLALSKYLNDDIKLNNKKKALLYKYCKKYLEKNKDKKLISSLQNYFLKYRKSYTLSPSYYVLLTVFISFIVLSSFTSSIKKNSMPIDGSSFSILKNNELSYTLDKNIKFKYPQSLKLEYSSDNLKRFSKGDSVILIKKDIDILGEDYYTKLNEQAQTNKELYSYKESEVSEVKEFTVNEITYKTATITNYYNSSNSKLLEKYIWTNLENNWILVFSITNPNNISEEELNSLLKIEIVDKINVESDSGE